MADWSPCSRKVKLIEPDLDIERHHKQIQGVSVECSRIQGLASGERLSSIAAIVKDKPELGS
jgi:hypothetical protein